jgi:ABC-type nitrate/sulfonate/bicarbonate transport system substrate-binding protein
MKQTLVLAALVLAVTAGVVVAQDDLRKPLETPVKARLGMLNVPALSPLYLLPEYAARHNIQVETIMFQRFADARTALASGDLDITAFGPQDITLAVAQGAKSLAAWRASARATTASSCARARTSPTGSS